MHTACTCLTLLRTISLSSSSAIDEARLDYLARIHTQIRIQRDSRSIEHGLGNQKTRITPNLQEIWSTPRRSWIPWRLIVKSWTFFCLPICAIIDSYFAIYTATCAMFLDSGCVGDDPQDMLNGSGQRHVGLGRLIVRVWRYVSDSESSFITDRQSRSHRRKVDRILGH